MILLKKINFRKFRQYLFDPLDGRKGKSVAKLLEENNIITKESFEDYQTLINQSADIELMRDYGPQSAERLQEKRRFGATLLFVHCALLAATNLNKD